MNSLTDFAVSYLNSADTDLTSIQVSYDILFRNFKFGSNLNDADIIIVSGSIPKIIPEKTYVFLVPPVKIPTKEDKDKSATASKPAIQKEKPAEELERYNDNKGNSVRVHYGNNMSVVEAVICYLNTKGFFDTEEGDLEIVPHIADILEIKSNSFMDNILDEIFNLIEANVNFKDYIIFLLKHTIEDEKLCEYLWNKYQSEFFVSFTTRSFSPDNYDLLT